MGPTSHTPFPLRMWRASLLHADTYEEVEADRSSIGQAFAVVLMASGAGALGTWIRVVSGHPLPESALPLPLHLPLPSKLNGKWKRALSLQHKAKQ